MDPFEDFDEGVEEEQQLQQQQQQSQGAVIASSVSATMPAAAGSAGSSLPSKMEDPEEAEMMAEHHPQQHARVDEDYDQEEDEDVQDGDVQPDYDDDDEEEEEETKPIKKEEKMTPTTVAPPPAATPQTYNWGGASASASAATPATPASSINLTNLQTATNVPPPTLQNVVSTVSLGLPVDLKKITAGARNAEYNPKRFAAVIMRIREPKATALIFASGKIVCTGARTETESKHAAKKFARIIQKLGYPGARFLDFKVQNMVASCDMKFPIKLEALALNQPLVSNYEPELFPGLIFRMLQPKLVLLIFVSGKIVITGAKSMEHIHEAVKKIHPVLLNYKKITPGPS